MMALKAAKTALSTILHFLTAIFGSPRGAVIALVLLCAGGYFYITQRVQISHLNSKVINLVQENDILTENNATLKLNQVTLEEVNKQTYAALQALKVERAKAKAAVEALALERERTAKALSDLQAKIEEMRKDPKNDGPVAPVLRETIRDIQTQRGEE